MERSLRSLLEGVIDYAGLFPPAKLATGPAVEEFLAYREGENAWLMTRFACSASHLVELAEELEKHPLTEPVPVTVIGTGGKDKHHWDTALALDIQNMAKFKEMTRLSAVIEAYEIRLPDNHHTEGYLHALKSINTEEMFIEIPWADGMEEAIACVAESEFAFAKARCGGLEASAFPSTGELAAFIQHCVQLDVPFKLTAGLHQPLPHFDKASNAEHHGFLNVLIATALSQVHDLSKREIEQILIVKDVGEFKFGANHLTWGTFGATIEEIAGGRELFRSFGSCSLEEPLEGLASAGLTTVRA